MPPHFITIPTADAAFHHFVKRTLARESSDTPAALERRLRRTNPRVVVRERGLAAEAPSWYVYRDGSWREPDDDRWWADPAVPRVETTADGWIDVVNETARGLLALDGNEPRHFTDFVLPGGLDDAVALFDIVRATGTLDATVLLQPTTGDAIAIDTRVSLEGDRLVAVFRLADDVDAAPYRAARSEPPERLAYLPRTDVAFRLYAQRALERMPEPTAEGLAIRLRRLYPHARVDIEEGGWTIRRDRDSEDGELDSWWRGEGLPCVRYEGLALILGANESANTFFGRELVGHHWQEFVTAGSTEEVETMLGILAEVGAAESRFRMPHGDGTLLEFDSYTVVDGDEFTTVFRPTTYGLRPPSER